MHNTRSSSTPTQPAIPSDIRRIPYRHPKSPRSGHTSPSSRSSISSISSISSRTPPPGPTTVVNFPATQPPTTMMPTAPTMMPPQPVAGLPINVVAAPPDHPGHALAHTQLPLIIIQLPVYPPQQQFQQAPPAFTIVHEPCERRRRRHHRYSTSSPSLSSFSSGTTHSRLRPRERRRRQSYTPFIYSYKETTLSFPVIQSFAV